MAEIVRHTRMAGDGLSPEQIARLNEAAKRPIKYTGDCPRLTDAQLAEFEPVNFSSWEKRTESMQEQEPPAMASGAWGFMTGTGEEI